VGTVVANLTVVLATGFVGGFGGAAIAGYGMASRLDYLLIPLLFALGTASLTMVGTNVGAGQIGRARHVAWIAALISREQRDSSDSPLHWRPLVGFASSAIHPK
jgi:Na+-driven multidrug efflux pump